MEVIVFFDSSKTVFEKTAHAYANLYKSIVDDIQVLESNEENILSLETKNPDQRRIIHYVGLGTYQRGCWHGIRVKEFEKSFLLRQFICDKKFTNTILIMDLSNKEEVNFSFTESREVPKEESVKLLTNAENRFQVLWFISLYTNIIDGMSEIFPNLFNDEETLFYVAFSRILSIKHKNLEELLKSWDQILTSMYNKYTGEKKKETLHQNFLFIPAYGDCEVVPMTD